MTIREFVKGIIENALTDAEIIFNPNAEYIYLSEANLRGKYDFGNVKKINLSFHINNL